MSSELGRLEKPEAEQFKGERKLYLVPLVFAPGRATPDYADLYERYWSGVREHLLKLEHSMGSIARVYHEGVGTTGDEGLDLIEQLSEKSASIARGKVEAGAVLEPLEEQELVAENLDWQRCLMSGLESRKVSELVWNGYTESSKKRFEVMASRVEETLKDEEAGLLFLSEEHKLQFPAGVRVFYVSPPALDEIHRWIRDQRQRRESGGSGEADR